MDILNDELACNKCREEAVSKAKYWFRSHIPGCCEGAPRRYITSNDKAEFLELLQKRCGKEYILGTCKDDHTYLMDVNAKTHWVAGFTILLFFIILIKSVINFCIKEECDKKVIYDKRRF